MWEFASVLLILFHWSICIFKPVTLVTVNEAKTKKGFSSLILPCTITCVYKDILFVSSEGLGSSVWKKPAGSL